MDDKTFVAHLTDLTAGVTYAEEEAIIPFVEVPAEDAVKMPIGTIFRWVIGYECPPDGTRNHMSQIVFRETPKMTKADFEEGKAWTRKIAQSFDC